MSSLLKELNNNPAQFTRIMEILNGMHDIGGGDTDPNLSINSGQPSSLGNSQFGWSNIVRKNKIREDIEREKQ